MGNVNNTLLGEILFEVGEIDKLINESREPMKECLEQFYKGTVDYLHRVGASNTLHSYYLGLENIFERINKRIDRQEFSGESTHRELLDLMKASNNLRDPVLSEKTGASLEEYRAFRHVARHVYGHKLKAEFFFDLVEDLEKNWKTVKKEVVFFAYSYIENTLINPYLAKIRSALPKKYSDKKMLSVADDILKEYSQRDKNEISYYIRKKGGTSPEKTAGILKKFVAFGIKIKKAEGGLEQW